MVQRDDGRAAAGRRREHGGVLPLVLLVLVVAAAAGGFNYWRNLQAESEEPRPYASYGDEEIAQLVAAYESEVARLDARYVAARDSRQVRQAASGAHISEQLEAFENASRSGAAVREKAADVAQQQAVLRDLRAEQAIRAERGAGLGIHWRRLTGL